MADPKIRRRVRSFDVTMASSVSSSSSIRLDDTAGYAIRIAAGVTATQFSTTVQIWASEDTDGTFARLYDSDGSEVDLTLVRDSANSTMYNLPDAVFPAAAIKLVPQSTHLTSCTVIVKS